MKKCQVKLFTTDLLALLLVAEGEQVGGEAGGGGGDPPALHQVARAQQVVHAHVQAGT